MRIISAGMDRSGSTWQFNAIRILYDGANLKKTMSSYWSDSKNEHRTDIEIVKAHRQVQIPQIYDEDIVFTSYRDVRAVIGSLIRMKWIANDTNSILDYVDEYIQRLGEWEAIAAVTMRYEDMILHPHNELVRASTLLNLGLSDAALDIALRRIEKLKMPDQKMDRVTQLHVKHIGDVSNDAAIMRVPGDAVDTITKRYGDWLRARGYMS